MEKVFNEAKIIKSNNITVYVSKIADPKNFIRKLFSAHSIKQLRANFTGPNPLDADELFQKPLSRFLQAANGESGTTIIKGANLDAEVVESVSRSTAATGNDASARIQKSKSSRPETIDFKGDPLRLTYNGGSVSPDIVARDMIKAYQEIRHGEKDA